MPKKASLGLESINLPLKPGPDKEVLCHNIAWVRQNMKLQWAKPIRETWRHICKDKLQTQPNGNEILIIQYQKYYHGGTLWPLQNSHVGGRVCVSCQRHVCIQSFRTHHLGLCSARPAHSCCWGMRPGKEPHRNNNPHQRSSTGGIWL